MSTYPFDYYGLCDKCGCCVCFMDLSSEKYSECVECKKAFCARCGTGEICKNCANPRNQWMVVLKPPRLGEVPIFTGPFARCEDARKYSSCSAICQDNGFLPDICPDHSKAAIYRLEEPDEYDENLE